MMTNTQITRTTPGQQTPVRVYRIRHQRPMQGALDRFDAFGIK